MLIVAVIVLGCLLVGSILIGIYVIKQYDKHCEIIEKNADKFAELNLMSFQWLKIHQRGKSIAEYFKNNGCDTVAVYGLSETGYACVSELEKNGVHVKYCIDRNADNIFSRVTVYRPDSELPQVDAVLVAVPQFFDDVKGQLGEKMRCPIVSLADVVWEV